MLRRDPTRIELRTEDLADFDRAREEYAASVKAAKKDLLRRSKAITTGPPPPTPITSEGLATASGSRTSTSKSKDKGKETQLDPIQMAQQERKGKSIRDRILGD
ncbi:hypothetical protein BX616_003873 [Lobosporangium transversale]|uniref:Anaphase-promoting complex, subunit CDC26 n=1 Tax=Lobosporangium transversale TaxID=64571 RepID=A0A1Y2GB77_9FUNG|nr:hypothetical protein BCR41DRAFT_400260 [Lobosporangium transversale]KAF9898562.1 hypothetical protein BX616_003873 [Lobosporangium transversale]ORZ06118.1 hypothetical protein BCR41DRAFT_400260 [Lobosporangium transversale]|eukprot:XP_021877387.1 hypothetical protein BCR41DRAFT_400260 [Lobosporangium transversale]